MNVKRFWIVLMTFLIILSVLAIFDALRSIEGISFFVALAPAFAAFCVISAINLFIMWIIPKMKDSLSAGRLEAMEGKDKH